MESEPPTLVVLAVGGTGSGKSTFINAFQNLAPGEEHAAGTAMNGGSKTLNPDSRVRHVLGNNRNALVEFVDLPGLGATDLSLDQSIKRLETWQTKQKENGKIPLKDRLVDAVFFINVYPYRADFGRAAAEGITLHFFSKLMPSQVYFVVTKMDTVKTVILGQLDFEKT
jgi:energy-coupling factor transporter ATP-binding protein EcfA2